MMGRKPRPRPPRPPKPYRQFAFLVALGESRAALIVGVALLALAMCMTGCAGMTPAETTTAVAVTGGFLTKLSDILTPFLSPEQQAVVTTEIARAGTLVDALGSVMETMGRAVAELREANERNFTPEETVGVSGAAVGIHHMVRNYTRKRDLDRATNG